MSRIVTNREAAPVKPTRQARRRKATKEQTEWKRAQRKVCPLCGKRPAAELHHIVRKGMGGCHEAECVDNWILICTECHDAFHAGRLPLRCVVAAKMAIEGRIDLERLEAIAGHNLPELEGIDNESVHFASAEAGRLGGKARAESLTPRQRKRIARLAARARWDAVHDS